MDKLDNNKIEHIKNGSRGNNHKWDKLVPDKNWEKIKRIISRVLKDGSEKSHGNSGKVFEKTLKIDGHEVQVRYTRLPDGTIRIGDAWIR